MSIDPKISFDDLLGSGAAICGDPDHCIKEIAKLKERFDSTQLLCWIRLGGLAHRKVIQSMDLMQKYVMPHFRDEDKRIAAASIASRTSQR